MITEEFIQIKSHNSTRKWYTEKGYKVPSPGKLFIVKISDLPEKSGEKVPFICDFCGDPDEKAYGNLINKEPHACKKCVNKKIDQTFQKNFNTEEKRKDLQRKRENTFAKNHDGHRTPFHIPEVVKKAQDTREELYGHKSYFGMIDDEKRHEVQCKIAKTFYENQTKQTSDEQIYLAKLFHGVINYNIEQYNVDIALLDEHIVIEFDGGGHDLSVTMGHVTREEFIEYELKREDVIFNHGFKLIRIVSPHDYLPEGEILLKLVNYCKDFKRSVIDLENNYVIINNKQIQFKRIL